MAYMILTNFFVVSVICSNLTLRKFVALDLGFYTFNVPAGILIYPITFLITDIISEIYGKQKATKTVFVGVISNFFVAIIILLEDALPQSSFSPVTNEMFHQVFGFVGLTFWASVTTFMISQTIDVHIFHFLKDWTRGKHAWLRNNLSTITSQFIDNTLFFLFLFMFSAIDKKAFLTAVTEGFILKFLFALADTPFFYLGIKIHSFFIEKKKGLAFANMKFLK